MDVDEWLTAFRIDVQQTLASAGMGGTSTQVPSSNSMHSMEGTSTQVPSFNSNNLNQLNMGAANVEDNFFRDFTNQVSQPGQNQLSFMNNNLHQQYSQSALMTSNMPYGLQKQQFQPVLQPQLHSSPQFMCPTLDDQWQMGQFQNWQLQNNFLERQHQPPLNQQPLELLCHDSIFQGGLQQMFQMPTELLDHQNPPCVFLNSSSGN